MTDLICSAATINVRRRGCLLEKDGVSGGNRGFEGRVGLKIEGLGV